MKCRKLFGLILSVLMAVSVFSVCVPAVSAAGTVVMVDVSCDMPTAGVRFDPSSQNWSVKVPADAHYSVSSCKWYPSDGSAEGAFTFEEGKRYIAVVTVVPDDGYLFSDYMSFSLDEYWQVLRRSRTKATLMINDYMIPLPVGKIGLSADVPRPYTSYDPDSGSYGATYVSVDEEYRELCGAGKDFWYPEGGKPGEALIFEGGARYCLEVKIDPVVGYVLSGSTAVTVNGEAADVTANGDGSLTVRKVFTIPVEKGEYKATAGEAVVWTKGDDWGPRIVFERTEEESLAYDRFVGVEIGGKKVASDQYFATRGDYGSLELTIRPEFLETLSRGKQTLTALFYDGEGESLIAVKGASVSPGESEESGDTPEENGNDGNAPGETSEESGETPEGSEESGDTPEEQDAASGPDDQSESEKPDASDPADESGSFVPEDGSASDDGGSSIPPWTGVVSVVLILAAAAVIAFAAVRRKKSLKK